LRKYPPVMTLGRECNSTTGYEIPEASNVKIYAGQVVQFPIYALHHSPDYWADPERFDPTRWLAENRASIVPYSYLPFGGGPRSCIGMRFAVSEAKLAIASIVERFQVVRTAKTPKKLKVLKGFPLLKTEEIFVGVKCR